MHNVPFTRNYCIRPMERRRWQAHCGDCRVVRDRREADDEFICNRGSEDAGVVQRKGAGKGCGCRAASRMKGGGRSETAG